MLWREFRIPIASELHTTEYVNGRGRISNHIPDRHVHEGQKFWKDFGREVAIKCLETLSSAEGLQVGAVWRKGPPGDINRTKRDAYSALVARLESELQESGELAMVFMDGDGSDSSYRATHRTLKLAERRVIEDAVHIDSKHSQLVQMADLVAWTANAHVNQHKGNAFAWGWYSEYLSVRDPLRSPVQI